MADIDGQILFKDFLPDLPDLNNPGMPYASNAMPVDGVYKPFVEPGGSGASLGATCRGSAAYAVGSGATQQYIYAGSSTALAFFASGAWNTRSGSTYNSASDYWRFARYENTIFATNYVDDVQYHTIGSATNFTAASSVTGSAIPRAKQIGVVGQFVVLGDTSQTATATQNSRIVWSGIDAPLSWPTPGSSTAVAVQSGEQYMPTELGEVTGIVGGDQFGLVLQKSGVSRMTYVGGNIVFQFDAISRGIGAFFPNATVQVGGLTYFVNLNGFWVSDGATVKSIGTGRVNEYFLRSNPTIGTVVGAHDVRSSLIWWLYGGNKVLLYNYNEDRWGVVDYALENIVGLPPESEGTASKGVRVFTTGHEPKLLSGNTATMILTTGEQEANPGGYSFLRGVKPLLGWNDSDATVGTLVNTIAVGYRNDNTGTVTYSAETTANSRTGTCDFRLEARYMRARLTINPATVEDDIRALGVQVDIQPSSGV